MKSIRITAVALSLGLAASALAGPVTVVNGSCESPLVSANFNTYNAFDNTSLTGWTVSKGSIDHIGNYWVGSDLRQSVDMSGNQAGQIFQNLTIPSAGTVVVNFDMAGNPDQQGLKFLDVDLVGAGGTQTFQFDSTGHTRSSMGWITETATFNAPAAGSYQLLFTSQNQSAFGAALDNVRVQVPDAGASWVLFGLGVGALGLLRRKVA